MKKILIQGVTLFCICLFATGIGMAAEAEKTKDWEFHLAPLYLWGANLSGDMTLKGNTMPINVSFDQIWDNLEKVFTVHFEGLYKKQWGFMFNLDYLDLSGSDTSPLGSVNVNLTETIAEFDGFYRVHNGPHSYDFLLGIRYTDIDSDANFVNIPLNGAGNENWMDAIVGLRYIYQISEKWNFIARGDMGAGGSDFTWQALGIVKFQAWKHVSFFGGYRGLGTDYSTGSGRNEFKYDMTMHGPILALNFTW